MAFIRAVLDACGYSMDSPLWNVRGRITECHQSLGRANQSRLSQYDDDLNQFYLPAYETVDLFVSRRLRHGVELYGTAQNIFDDRIPSERRLCSPLRAQGPFGAASAGLCLANKARQQYLSR